MPCRILRLAALVIVAWCVMTFTHELGHLATGWICGGSLVSVELRPWRLPCTVFVPDSHPLATLWGGPVLGVVLPLGAAAAVRRPGVWFVAHFCVLANGLYLSAAWISGDRYLDTPRLFEHGAHPALVAAYCLATVGCGYVGFRRHCIRILSGAIGQTAPAAAQRGGTSGRC